MGYVWSPAEDISSTTSLVEANNKFAFDIYQVLKKEEGNIFFSPFSIATALTMTLTGARGNTELEMQKVLHLTEIVNKKENISQKYKLLCDYINSFQQKEGILLSVANSLWLQKEFDVEQSFQQILRNMYASEIFLVDFQRETENARLTINKWVEQKTQDKIKDLLSPGSINPLVRLILVNAIYFKGKWYSEFDKNLTKEDDFFLPDGEKVKVNMMTKKETCKYAENDELQVLELEYKTSNISMVLFLPRQRNGLSMLESKLNMETMQSLLNSMRMKEIKVFLPRFTFTSQFSLSSVLKTIGMQDAFDPMKADFTGISKSDKLFIFDVLHKAFVEVNEEGTEAAAATGVIVGITCVPAEPVVFRADHPFLFAIRERTAGSILFIGRVYHPAR
jgi:serpin B